MGSWCGCTQCKVGMASLIRASALHTGSDDCAAGARCCRDQCVHGWSACVCAQRECWWGTAGPAASLVAGEGLATDAADFGCPKDLSH